MKFIAGLLSKPLRKVAGMLGLDMLFFLQIQLPLLVNEGRRAEALAMLEADAGLGPEDLTDVGRLHAKLRARLSGMDPDTAALYATTLAGLLGMEGRRDRALTLAELDAGLSPGDYGDRERLSVKVRDRLQALTADMAVNYMQSLVSIYGMAERHGEGLALMEADFNISGDDYGELARLHTKLRQRLEGVTPALASFYVVTLSMALDVVGRATEGLRVLEADLGLSLGDFGDFPRLRAKIDEKLTGLPGPIAFTYLLPLFTQLSDSGRDADGVALLEAYFGVEAGDYDDAALLTSRVHGQLEGVSEEVIAQYTMVLAAGLGQVGRGADALKLMGAELGIGADDYGDPARLASKLRARLGGFSPEVAATYMRPFVGTLRSLGRLPEAVAVMEVDADLAGADYSNLDELRSRLEPRLTSLTSGTAGAYVFEVVSLLRDAGEHGKAAQLLECYLGSFARLETKTGGNHSLTIQVCPLCQYWLEYRGTQERGRTLEVCAQAVAYLRHALADRGAELADREEFIGYVEGLRRGIAEAGHYWASLAGEGEEGDRLRITAQIWDAELTQRVLLERFQLQGIEEPLAPAEPPRDAWPCSDPPPASQGYLPTPDELTRVFDGTLDASVAFLDEPSGESRQASPHPPSQPAARGAGSTRQAHPELFRRAQEIVREGVSEELLARLLGARDLLLRMTFDSRRGLLWTAVEAGGETSLRIVAHHRGQDGDLNRLRWATAKHDFRHLLARKLFTTRRGFALSLSMVLKELGAALDEALALVTRLRHETGGDAPEATLHARAPFDALEELARAWAGRQGEPASKLQLELLRTWQWALADPPEGAEALALWLDEAAARLAELKAAAAPARGAGRLRELLDDITRAYVEEVSGILKLDALAGSLTDETDVLLQVDDALHAVPLAHVPVASVPFFQRVRSLRTSLSVLFSVLQQEAGELFGEGDEEDDGRRMLTVSWFDRADDPANRSFVRWLHHGHFRLAREYGLTCYAAADDPAGAVGTVGAALDKYQSFRIVTVCGHGLREQAGVSLSSSGGREQALWRGDGCDLSRVEWLLMVSCSIGRLAQTGDRDVSGFCVNLALHRMLSATACRWPVLTLEACLFANEAARHFLQLRAEHAGARQPGQGRLRARALNAARKSFLGDGAYPGRSPYPGLNTVAAFELYGLG